MQLLIFTGFFNQNPTVFFHTEVAGQPEGTQKKYFENIKDTYTFLL